MPLLRCRPSYGLPLVVATAAAAFQKQALVARIPSLVSFDDGSLQRRICCTKRPRVSAARRRVIRSVSLQNDEEEDEEVDSENGSGRNVKSTAEEINYLRNELLHIESLEQILAELEAFTDDSSLHIDDDNELFMDDFNEEMPEFGYDHDEDLTIWDKESLEELLLSLPDDDDDDANQSSSHPNAASTGDAASTAATDSLSAISFRASAALGLERALLQGVVPVRAGVGSECLPGDFGFDPLHLAERDLMRPVQRFLLNRLPPPILPSSTSTGGGSTNTTLASDTAMPPSLSSSSTIRNENDDLKRPKALILRDYREAEIRHGRLAMLAAMIWPLQEMLDRFLLRPDQFGPLVYGPVTLPYFPLAMTAILMLLGYLDIYSQAIKDRDQIGEAFLPGDCFWDPLRILEGAPDRMKRNMQERELFNGRAAMLAVAAYFVEEVVTHKALIDIESNALLLEPAYQVPFIQSWLDSQFTSREMMVSLPDLLSGLDVEAF